MLTSWAFAWLNCCGECEMSLWTRVFEYLHGLQPVTGWGGCEPPEAELLSPLCILTADTM